MATNGYLDGFVTWPLRRIVLHRPIYPRTCYARLSGAMRRRDEFIRYLPLPAVKSVPCHKKCLALRVYEVGRANLVAKARLTCLAMLSTVLGTLDTSPRPDNSLFTHSHPISPRSSRNINTSTLRDCKSTSGSFQLLSSEKGKEHDQLDTLHMSKAWGECALVSYLCARHLV
ncbi:hypothetical protein SODALDRAFT_355665 [Sodiomyces alkalinus F11]|uniref:Uncharacterized protein n=1 Tax=Sodiomyces alkalinus (strain CBS 110278 / VKM F-3762 / F11) TaxID=1314773 RepID=A0A3N2Q9M0_SODAK|nr:hypothetical protein SODALDRAFT_355665 [Sodiomyces alkalinus F11]ROT43459.1 hypothetical protein SODALDRAFT_355665 [Sodiomyces alkalinus F11]